MVNLHAIKSHFTCANSIKLLSDFIVQVSAVNRIATVTVHVIICIAI